MERGASALTFDSPRNASEAFSGCGQESKGYAWDCPSGPTLDTRNFMRGSLVHDALYQLMRESLLDHTIHREPADRILQSLCREDGMTALRAWWVYQGVRLFGNPASDPAQQRPVLWAPGREG